MPEESIQPELPTQTPDDGGPLAARVTDERATGPRVAMSRRTRVFAGVCACLLGVLGGLGAFTFGYGDGAAYLTKDPAACANCHIMQSHFDSWTKSSHKSVATCNDCHLPHNFVGKWTTKADNGFFHSLAFTTNDFHEPIQIKARNRRVTQHACLFCHGEFVDHMKPSGPALDFGGGHEDQVLSCIHCHSDVGHALKK